MPSVERALAAREFDKIEVRELLDGMDEYALRGMLGDPEIRVAYADGIGYWRQGDSRPVLAEDDPAVMQAIGRCAVARTMSPLPGKLVIGEADKVHPVRCGWCDYPLQDLLAACDWSTWFARYRVAELLTWRKGEEGRDHWITYSRGGGAPVYENPLYAAFWAQANDERELLVQDAIRGSQSGDDPVS